MSDEIVFDSSAVGATPAVLDLIPHADVIVVTAKVGHTSTRTIERTIAILRDIATAPGGIVTAVPCPPVTAVAMAPPPVCPSPEKSRGSLFALYLWATSLRADLRVGPLETSVDASFSDLLKDLDFAFAGYYETWKEKRGFYLDLMYVRLSDEEDLPLTSVDVTVQQTLAEAGLVFRGGMALRGGDGIVGARYMNFRNELSFLYAL